MGGLARLVLCCTLGSLAAGCGSSEPVTPEAATPGTTWLADRGLVYCYRTIADADCHPHRLADAGQRLIAVGPRVSFRPQP